MTKKKSTKQALLSSLLILTLCVTMFFGSTYAWFTDSVTSGNNIIKSGTLEVTMEWADGTEAIPEANSTDWKDASTGEIFKYDQWEPGYTEVRHIKIANEGTLALKYHLNIKATGEVSELADVIDVYFIDGGQQITARAVLAAENKVGTLTQVLAGLPASATGEIEAGEDADIVTIALKMQESAGNEYQNLSIGSAFAVELMATQLAAEEDSFGPDYDEDAMTFVKNADELKDALASANDGAAIYLAPVDFGNVDLYNTTNNGHRYEYANYKAKNISIIGQSGTTFSKLRLGENDDAAIVMTGWTFKNIAFANGDGLILSINNLDVTLDNCTFTNTEIQAAGADCISKNLTISECTFDGSHATRKTQLHIQGSEGLTVIGCTFTDGLYNAMALSDIRGDVTIDDNTITGSADRAFRFSGVGANVNIVVKNNTITDSAREKEGKYQVICIGNNDGVPATSSISFTGNTYDGAAWAEGMLIANTTVETIICSDNTRIDG